MILAHWPVTDNQLTDPSPNASLNCGPESVREDLFWATGKDVPAETILEQIGGPTYHGYTYAYQLVDVLNARGVTAGTQTISDPNAALSDIKKLLDNGYPALVLFYWDIPARTGGHWCPVIGYNADGSVIRSNPWGGVQETLDAATWQRGYQGWYLSTQTKPPALVTPPAAGPWHFRVKTETELRGSMNLGDVQKPIATLRVGDIVDHPGGTAQSPHWLYVVTEDAARHEGYAFLSDLVRL